MFTRSSVLIFFLLLIISGVLRFYSLGGWSFDMDELFTTLEAKILFGESVVPDEYLKNGQVKAEDTQLYRLPRLMFVSYFVHWVGYKIFGEDEFGSRIVPAFLGSLSVGVIFLFGRFLFGFVVGLVLSLLAMFLPEHLLHSQCNRFYVQSFFIISVVFLSGYYVLLFRSFRSVFFLGLLSILMIFINSFGGLIWGVVLCGVILGVIFSSNYSQMIVVITTTVMATTAKTTATTTVLHNGVDNCLHYVERAECGKSGARVILFMFFWSALFLCAAYFYIIPMGASWNKSLSWGYSPFHALASFVNMISWPVFLFSVMGFCILFFGGNISCGNIFRRNIFCGNIYWLVCIFGCGFIVFVLPMVIVYNSNYGFLFIFPFIVSAAIFIGRVYDFILRLSFSYKNVLGVIWVCGCVLLNFPSVASYYCDGNRHDNRAAFYYVAENWRQGDRLTGILMGAAKYYIPDKTPRIPLHPEPDKTIKELQNIIDNNIGGSGRLWIVLTSSRGGIDDKVRKWLGQNAKFEYRAAKKRFDYAENNVEVFIVDKKEIRN
ncbi:MAG: hypothetical protein LBP59_05235 [Planctomycetaceae bacterium]|jgi:hypothetical protein|nr:hypothetical protein [Planctomycetaceae bacterium]